MANCNEMITILPNRFVAESNAQGKVLYNALPDTGRITTLLDHLLDAQHSNNHMALVTRPDVTSLTHSNIDS